MGRGIWRQSPALVVLVLALFVGLGGTVYAAKQAKLNGKAIRAKSLPGNRLKLRSVAANRLKPGVLKSLGLSGPLTGSDVNELTLSTVPNAAHAEEADFAAIAGHAQTAVEAINAQTVNGYGAGCKPGTRLFAGACWQSSPSAAAVTAPQAASECAAQGGALPDAIHLAAFAKEPGVNLHEGDEWTSTLMNFSGPNSYGVVTVSGGAVVDLELSSTSRRYRCVIPLVS